MYEITAAGRETLHGWLTAMLGTPPREFPEFPVALAPLPLLEPAQVADLLEARITAMRAARATHPAAPPGLPRLFLIEDEYRQAVEQAELAWLRRVVADLRAGTLTWDRAALADAAAG